MYRNLEDLVFLAPILSDETRRKVFCHALETKGGVTAAEVSSHFAIHRTVARMHLEKLARSQLLLRSAVRSGSSGRPAVCYRPRPEHSIGNGGSQPQLLASLLARAISDLGQAGLDSIRNAGARIAVNAVISENGNQVASLCEELESALAMAGRPASAELTPDNSTLTVGTLGCPFNAHSSSDPQTVCAADEHLVKAMVDKICERHHIRAETLKCGICKITEAEPGARKHYCQHVYALVNKQDR